MLEEEHEEEMAVVKTKVVVVKVEVGLVENGGDGSGNDCNSGCRIGGE